jgi:signal transduction histidine kinase
MLQRACHNLLHNAIKFSPEGGTVTVRIADSNGYWDVSVIDHGVGLSRDAQRRLLGMRGTAEGSHETGIVLGLALVRTVIDRHGSVLKIDSAPGKGSTFYFRLPRYKEPPARSRKSSSKKH